MGKCHQAGPCCGGQGYIYIYLGSKKMEGKYSLGLLLEGKLAGAMQLETKALV